MNELIKIHDHQNKKVVSARELHYFLESKREFTTWIKQRIEQYGFVENVDYTSFDKIVGRETGATVRKEYAISIDMAKELSMVENNDKGKIARKYFIERDNQLRQVQKSISLPDFTNPAEAAIAWAEQYKQKELAEATIKQLSPKASFAERVLDTDESLVDIGQAAKLLKLPFGRNKFFEKLRNDGVFFKNRNEPRQEYIDKGYFDIRKKEVERNNHANFVVLKVLATSKGLYWLSQRYGSNSDYSKVPNLQLQ